MAGRTRGPGCTATHCGLAGGARAYWTADSLPLGSHFAARFGDELTLLSLAGQLERAQPWAARRPQLNAYAVDAKGLLAVMVVSQARPPPALLAAVYRLQAYGSPAACGAGAGCDQVRYRKRS
ncbi:Asp-tRNAAsn/Glu-tRNAGln amidotransferase A subunit and related amidase [Pseudomonas savastanoi pv. nerii]|nr:hypothetical protein ALO78_200003 [Pseudomonas amygdali pv. ciccaronei]KPX02324.1 Asp-tRNAAsn/Glu-tRNAGln amidotransferase A subunit and related amidase [Pseudomonas syringae pv. cunninghamiae]KPY04220.1 Asp-tRNAAsn/Glu-tRNAGln amidotransferase A subunit and related amidase [Pseudomonas savastanoi pv. nerii]KPY66170.1 Asp-tRNAAsn/Glu-tRNAGln amidotransferase A subunit and related amidase [Pseudomonas savastanoi pv. savastanoi]RML20197.1 Asp-tRNAAsn/Glu-tRNAGln amidotransferase A subunit and 